MASVFTGKIPYDHTFVFGFFFRGMENKEIKYFFIALTLNLKEAIWIQKKPFHKQRLYISTAFKTVAKNVSDLLLQLLAIKYE